MTHHDLSAADLRRLARSGPAAGSTWRHRGGGAYVVVLVALRESDLTPAVVYRGTDGVCWTRPLPEFLDGRFEKIADGGGTEA